ncbi:MAG: TonB family protein [Prevotella sp.]|nr:TonB family protein [Prevotella sp.]
MMMRYVKCVLLFFWTIQVNVFSQSTASEMYETGFDYHYGLNGKSKDDAKAVEWFGKAADQGLVEAQAQLGYMLLYGYGVNKDYAEALKWYRKAADQENASAQNQLGLMYLNGYGVNKDYAEALKWYRKAADQGLPSGLNGLGFMYQNGYGVTQDYAEALKWYRQAAEKGNAAAKNNIGTMYFNGYGVTQDYAEALDWYLQAAELGDVNGLYSAGFMYDNGYGVTKNMAEARKWYEKAAAQGDGDARERLKEIQPDAAAPMQMRVVAEPKNEVDNNAFEVVEQPPTFPGNVFSWLSRNIHYPALAEEGNIQGRVIVAFIVEADGSVSDVQVAKGVDPLLDKEAVRVVKSMPKWTPGLHNGQPVRVMKTLPVSFKIQ